MARNDEEVLDLVGRVYDAAVDPAVWPDVLTALTDAVGGAQVIMGMHDFATRPRPVLAPRLSPESLADYRDRWARHDVLWQRTNAVPVGQVFRAERFVPREEYRRTRTYNEWHRPLGIGVAGLAVNLFVEDGVSALCGIKRPAHRDEFSQHEVSLFCSVAPHLVRAVKMQRRLVTHEYAGNAARAIAESERSCVMVVDATRQALEADAAARRVLDRRDGVRVENGRLTTRDPAASARLERLIDGCGCKHHTTKAGGSVCVPRGRDRAPLRLDVMPLSPRNRRVQSEWLGLQSPAAIVAISDPERPHGLSRTRLMATFGLTPAEADLAIEMARGDGRQAAARRLGVSVGTVRSHLMRIFEKTGVSRQAELVHLLLDG